MLARHLRHFSADEYLEIEVKANEKSEFVQGEIYAMAGASYRHEKIISNTITVLSTQLRKKPCDVLGSNMRVQSATGDFYTYPDITILCGKKEMGAHDTLKNPFVIIEVLSPATENYDRNEKFRNYQNILSLREYILISQDKKYLEKFEKTEGGWIYSSSETKLELNSTPCSLDAEEVYRKVDFTAA